MEPTLQPQIMGTVAEIDGGQFGDRGYSKEAIYRGSNQNYDSGWEDTTGEEWSGRWGRESDISSQQKKHIEPEYIQILIDQTRSDCKKINKISLCQFEWSVFLKS